jgi:hypothetical protein
VAEYLAAGADAVVGKPLKQAKLKALLDAVTACDYRSQPGMKLRESPDGTSFAWMA